MIKIYNVRSILILFLSDILNKSNSLYIIFTKNYFYFYSSFMQYI